jgi:hypothetical protein
MKRDPRLAPPPIPLDHADPTDQEAINEYLRVLRCRRMCLAQELDEAKYRQTCGELDMECDICEARREQGTASTDLPETNLRQGTVLECSDDNVAEEAEDESENGGAMRYRRRQMQDQFEMDEYLRRLSQVKGHCIICRILTPGVDWRHEMSKCPRAHKWDFIRCKKAVTQRSGGRQWIKNYTACYLCGQPQSVCANWAAKEKKAEGCQCRDLVMPAVWALWEEGWEERRWVRSRLEVEVSDGGEAMIAAARVVKFAGIDSIVGVKILAALLARWSGD